MSQIKDLVREINKGKNLEHNIPFYRDVLFDIYNQTAFLHITMDYFVLYETLQEKNGEENGYLKDAIEVINQVVNAAFCQETLTDEKISELLEKLLNIRNEVINKMKSLTMYTDK